MPTLSLAHSYTPRGVLAELYRAREPEVLVSGPAGTGKSMACLERLHAACLMNPGMRGLIVRKTLASLGSTALVTWRKRVVPEAMAAGTVKYYGGSAEEPPQYRYTNGARVVIGGMDKAIRIMSSEYDLAYVQEATELTVEDWESITTRLRYGVRPVQQVIADCNPGAPTHWLKQRVDAGRVRILESRHEDNPELFHLMPDGTHSLTDRGRDYIAKLDALTGVRYWRLRKGLWVAAEGVIFEDFDPAVHMIDTMPAGWRDWPRYWSIDFGFVNPFVCQFWAEDPDGRLYLYREIYRTGRTVDQLAHEILKTVGITVAGDGRRLGSWTEPQPVAIICDHDAENRAVLARELGLGTRPAKKKVQEGIQKAQARFRPRGDGSRGIYILRGARTHQPDPVLVDKLKPTCTADELPAYVWDTAPGKKVKEDPLKVDDHGCDALRYFVADRDLRSSSGVRFM